MSKEIIYEDVFAVFEHLNKSGWSINLHTPPYFQAMQLYGERCAFLPMPSQPLFRGQNSYHSPSYPSLYRKKWTFVEEFERELLLNDFELILNDNPEIIELKKAGMYINYKGLAQHYGIDTNMMDLTNSPLIASFFATTDYDAQTDRYYPIIERVRKGVIYFQPIGIMINSFKPDNPVWPIGMEALRRPGEQRAFSMELNKGDDFNSLGGICLHFWQTPEASNRIFKMTNYGKLLFPYDPMTQKVRMMRKLRVFSKSSFVKTFNALGDNLKSEQEILNLLNSAGCSIQENSLFLYTEEEKKHICNVYEKQFSLQ